MKYIPVPILRLITLLGSDKMQLALCIFFAVRYVYERHWVLASLWLVFLCWNAIAIRGKKARRA